MGTVINNEGAPLIIRRRNLPHWELAGSTYFITFRLKEGRLSPEEVGIVLEQIKKGEPAFYKLFTATVIPDHVHAVLRPQADASLARITKGIKGVSARLINERRGNRGALWQDESYDRVIRDEKEFAEKTRYVFNNAVKRGLCDDGWDYPGFYCKET
jgi:REP element-mobilizing transposase RayT